MHQIIKCLIIKDNLLRIYYLFINLWVSDFVLPIVSVGVSEIIEPLKEDKELAGRSLLLVERDGDTNFVSI